MRLIKFLLLIGALAAFLVIAGIGLMRLDRWRMVRARIQEAEPMRVVVEKYRQQHGRYPESLSEATISEPRDLFYQWNTNDSYILWFGMELGESVAFDSTTGRWE